MTMHTTKILLVEDDRRIRIEVMDAMRAASFDVEAAVSVQGAREMLEREFDLVLLDLGLPDGDGLDVCREIRGSGRGVPILILTARDEPGHRVRGLEVGADDYVVKPFHMPELVARVRGLLRRSGRQVGDGVYRLGELWADRDLRRAGRADLEFTLRRREFDLLLFLMQHPGRPWSREQLIDRVWGSEFDGDARTVDIHVRRVRQQIEPNPSRPRWLMTEFGVGYRMQEGA